MEKTYERINWENYPSVVTPINEKNLNKMDSALDEVDNRVIGLDTAKLDKSIANTMIKDLDVDETTGIFTITYLNGTEKKVDTGLEKIATNFSYNRDTQKLVLTLTDGTEQEVDLSSLISQYEFTDSDYITFEVGNDGKVKATIKSGSITEDMLQPNFLADVKVEVEKAKTYSNSASNSSNEAKQYRDEAEQFRNEASSFVPEGYDELVQTVEENTVKIDTLLEKAGLEFNNTAKGSNIHLTDSADSNVVALELYCKTEQNETPSPNNPQEIKSVKGKNLLDCRGLTEQVINGVTFTPVYDSNGNLLYINANGTASADAMFRLNTFTFESKDYILSGCPSGGNYSTYMIYANQSYDEGNGVNMSFAETVTYSVWIRVASGVTLNNLKFYPMIRLASIKDDTYVPYGLLRIKTQGKNFVDMSNPLAVTNMSYNDTTKTYVQTSADTFTSFNLYIRQLKEYNITTGYEWILDKVITTAQTISCTFTKLSGYNAISIKHNGQAKDVGISLDISNLKDGVTYYFKMNIVNATQGSIEFGEIIISETESDYIPYQSTEITLSEPIELNGFNGVYDVVTSEGVTRRFGKVVYDGSDDENWIKHSGRPNTYYIYQSDKLKGGGISSCSHYRYAIPDKFVNIDYCYYNGDDIMFKNKDCNTLEEWKAELQSNPVTVVYELATPTTEAMQNDFNALKTFYPETYISNDADCDMSVTYLADAKNYIDNKLALLEMALFNNL